MNFANLLKTYQQRTDTYLTSYLPLPTEIPTILHQAMRYVVLNGGKRLRPALIYATGNTLGCKNEYFDIPACAIEFMHCYSLVHDDLPAMDNAELRRGQTTCHKAYDEATAILVGDALQNLAFKVIADTENFYSSEQRIKMISILATANSSQGMIGGQSLDLASEKQFLDREKVTMIHQLKTSTLLEACVKLSATAADCTDLDTINRLEKFASCIGLAFQIQDDILDGKKSEESENVNYVSVTSLSEAKAKVASLHEEAESLVLPLSNDNNELIAFSQYLAKREF